MLYDMQELFSGSKSSAGVLTGQALTATAISENVLDLRNNALPALANEGIKGPELYLYILVQTAAAGGDAAKTVTFTLESDSTANLATSPTVHWTSTAITGATLVAGYVVAAFQLPVAATYERYLGLRYTVSAGFTAFNLLAFLTLDIPANLHYRAGYTI